MRESNCIFGLQADSAFYPTPVRKYTWVIWNLNLKAFLIEKKKTKSDQNNIFGEIDKSTFVLLLTSIKWSWEVCQPSNLCNKLLTKRKPSPKSFPKKNHKPQEYFWDLFQDHILLFFFFQINWRLLADKYTAGSIGPVFGK